MIKYLSLICISTLALSCSSLQSETAEISISEELVLIPNNPFDLLYIQSGVNFSTYKTMYISPPKVEFEKNWQRRQNRNDAFRVNKQDIENIRNMISQQLVDVFDREISESSTYTIVRTPEDADLILKPELVNLDIVNPLNNQPYRIKVMAKSSGRMTLNGEIIETATNQALLKFSDKNRSRKHQDFRWQSSVRIKSETNRILTRWAKSLNLIINAETAEG
ncbi:MAG: DUF3313 family protein [Pseudomonadota bacterium]|nr:DUF3313 family protein [Pseudomonadota bacterium]